MESNNTKKGSLKKHPLPGSKISVRQKVFLVFFGLCLTIVLLEAGLRLGGFIILSFQEGGNRLSMRQKASYRILCVGESTTQNQYPCYLEKILNRRSSGTRFSVIDKGVTGTTSTAISNNMESYLAAYHPDMVVVMMGINDSGDHMPFETEASSRLGCFIASLRTYRLAKLLLLHLAAKVKEIKSPRQLMNTKLQAGQEGGAPVLFKYGDDPEEFLEKKAEIDPENPGNYWRLGELDRQQGNLTQAEEMFKKGIEADPGIPDNYWRLGELYKLQGRFSQAREIFMKGIEANPRSPINYWPLGDLYRRRHKFSLAEEMFKKGIEVDPEYPDNYWKLGELYRYQNKFSHAEEVFKKVIEIIPSERDRAYGALATIYAEQGLKELAEEYYKKANETRAQEYKEMTIYNYRSLKEMLNKRGVRLVCVQYPMRRVDLFKKIFAGQSDEVIFVDNEEVFKEVVRKEGYWAYFEDMFGGDFGHCTQKGNQLLAENIADTILKEVFSQ